MTSYNRTIIVEANSKNRVISTMKSNDFVVQTPQVSIPRGSQIELDGCVVEEVSAGNNNIIELSNFNVSEQQKYVSSYQLLEIRYYINNSAMNTICQPCIQNNYVNVIADGRTPSEWGDKEYFPYETTYAIPYHGMSVPIDLISGPTPCMYNTVAPTQNVGNYTQWFNNNRHTIAYANPTFVRWNPTGGTGGTGDWINFGNFNIVPNPTPADYSQNSGGFKGIVGIKSALKKRSPDSKKFTYMQPGYGGPHVMDESDYNGTYPELKIYTNFVEIDLQNDLLETPDELAILVNNKLQGSNLNEPNNLKKVMSHTRQWSTDFSDGSVGSDLYPAGSLKEITSITSNTLINIPANFQNSETSTVYGEGFFTQNSDRWSSGNTFLKLTNYRLPPNVAGGAHVEGSTPYTYTQYIPAADQIMFNTTLDPNMLNHFTKLFPTTPAFCMDHNLNWITPFYTNEGCVGQFIGGSAPPGWSYVGITGFSVDNPDGTSVRVSDPDVSFYLMHGTGVVPTPGTSIQFRTCKFDSIEGKTIMKCFPAINNGNKIIPTGQPADFYFHFGREIQGKDIINLIAYQDQLSYPIEFAFQVGGGAAGPFRQRTGAIHNGLPYYAITGSTGGGRLANDPVFVNVNGQQIGSAEVDEYLCIPDGYLIPTNINCRGEYTTASLKRIADFFRANERYAGSKTTYMEQQNDKENWYVDLDVGFADDFNNAMSNWVSCKTKDFPSAGDFTDFTIYDEQQNYSMILPYYSNITSKAQYTGGANNPVDRGNIGFNFRNPLTIYPISRYANMGCNYKSNENYIRVYSRFFPTLRNKATLTNQYMNVDFQYTGFGQRRKISHPSIDFDFNDNIMDGAQRYDIAICQCNLADNTPTYGFINFKATFKGNGQENVYYDFDDMSANNNWRQCFRILSFCPIGFDPASTTNPFCNSMNIEQTNTVNPQLEAKDFFSIRKVGQTSNQPQELEQPSYSDNIVYSCRVEDYLNSIYIGAVAPTLQFNNSRMELTNMFTPRQYNAYDANGSGDPNIGLKVCFFNDPTPFFPMLNNTLGSVPDEGPPPASTHPLHDAVDLPGDFQQVRNTGINDSLSGIGIENLYVREEKTKGNRPGDLGIHKCRIIGTDETFHYDGCLFNLFGFSLRQFKPYYGVSYERYSQSNYNSIDSTRYDGLNFFTVNAFVNQSNMQNLSIFGPNYLSSLPAASTSQPNPPTIGGQPFYSLGYVGYQPSTIQVDTDRLRGETLPAKLQNAFYMIYTNLPNSRYITNNGEMNIIGYFYRQYKSGNFYFSYPTSYTKTITKEFDLTNIRVSILNSNGRPAEHIGSKVSCFFKITIPSILPQQTPEEAEEYIEANQKPQPLDLPESDPLLEKEFNILIQKSIATGIPLSQLNPSGDLGSPDVPDEPDVAPPGYRFAYDVEGGRFLEPIRQEDRPETKEPEKESETKEPEDQPSFEPPTEAPSLSMIPIETIFGEGRVETRLVGVGDRISLSEFTTPGGVRESVGRPQIAPLLQIRRQARERRIGRPRRARTVSPRRRTIGDLPMTPRTEEAVRVQRERGSQQQKRSEEAERVRR